MFSWPPHLSIPNSCAAQKLHAAGVVVVVVVVVAPFQAEPWAACRHVEVGPRRGALGSLGLSSPA